MVKNVNKRKQSDEGSLSFIGSSWPGVTEPKCREEGVWVGSKGGILLQDLKLDEGNIHAGDDLNEVLESYQGEESNCMGWYGRGWLESSLGCQSPRM